VTNPSATRAARADRPLRSLLRYVRPYRWRIALAAAATLAATACQLIPPYLTKAVIDRYLETGAVSGLTEIAALYIAALMGGFVFQTVRLWMVQMVGHHVTADLRLELFRKLQRLDFRFFDREPLGGSMARVMADADTLQEIFSGGAMSVIFEVITLCGIAVVLVWMDWRLALFAATVLPFVALVIHWFQVNVRKANRKVRALIGDLTAFMQERISGMTTVQMYGAEASDRAAFSQFNDAHSAASARSYVCHRVLNPAMQLADALAVALIVWIGGGLMTQEAVMLGTLVAFLQYLQRFFLPMTQLADMFGILHGVSAALERIFALLDTPIEMQSPRSPVPIRMGTIRFERVTFGYVPGRLVLNDVSFEIRRGQRIGIVGTTGAGKSTIVNLLMRFYDVTDGRITIDGEDIRNFDPRELRAQFGLMLQDVCIFSGTIAENVRFGNAAICSRQIKEALEAVHANRIVDCLPGGLDAVIAERGATLSAGERQLLSFARALVLNPPVFVLDEATSNVDTNTEFAIDNALRTLMRGHTRIVIAHRLSTIRDMDGILVLHDGRVCEFGRHEELLARRGIYYRLSEVQLVSRTDLAGSGPMAPERVPHKSAT
jgi:ATP-binding cassette subfamily B protein